VPLTSHSTLRDRGKLTVSHNGVRSQWHILYPLKEGNLIVYMFVTMAYQYILDIFDIACILYTQQFS
jgi:hypothetical protein